MPASALALVASATVRAASLNLCTDEYLLMLARPGEVVSISYLGAEPAESVLWRRAKGLHRNRGTLESALQARPNLIFTMGGGGGRATAAIAARLRLKVVDLPYPASLADVRRQGSIVAAALGRPGRARPLLSSLATLERNRPIRSADAAYLGGGGNSTSPGSLGAEWLALAGYRQRPLPNNRLTHELLATNPPRWLIKAEYRSGQWSRGQGWLAHPLVRRLENRMIWTDGRAWTCGGLPMIAEVQRLRRMPH